MSKSKFSVGDLVTLNCNDARYHGPASWGVSKYTTGKNVELSVPGYIVTYDADGHESGYIRELHNNYTVISGDVYLVTEITSTSREEVGYARSNMSAPAERLVILTPRGLCIVASFYMKKVR